MTNKLFVSSSDSDFSTWIQKALQYYELAATHVGSQKALIQFGGSRGQTHSLHIICNNNLI